MRVSFREKRSQIGLDKADAGKLSRRKLSKLIQTMIFQRLPQVRIIDNGNIFGWLAVSQPVTSDFFLICPPALVAAASQINFAIDNPLTIVQVVLDCSIRINDTAAATELHATFETIAVRSYKVHAILKCSCHPPATWTFFFQPVRRKKQNIRIV